MTDTNPTRSWGFVLNDVARLMRKRFEQRARSEKLPLTRAQYSVLAHLARNEGVNQTTLASILEVEPITLARQLDRLESARLVERRTDPNDRRAYILYLTETARPLLDRIWRIAEEVREEAMAGLPQSGRDTLVELLHSVRANLCQTPGDRDGGAPARELRHG
ncbi:MarR family winged helix-turn-helix transcriptional regulator [Zavarzinia sp. CC-PAN008]|uniref:MarR family winged helix-turn-helix transcriptional regulator n=1 Tax=Zavarzinia sp. CC-PAN008 TaxID=3243332 RepID=UPI003F748C28